MRKTEEEVGDPKQGEQRVQRMVWKRYYAFRLRFTTHRKGVLPYEPIASPGGNDPLLDFIINQIITIKKFFRTIFSKNKYSYLSDFFGWVNVKQTNGGKRRCLL